MRILFAASEAYPLIKTGGLADVAGGLTRALVNAGEDLRLVLPAYAAVKAKLGKARCLLQAEVAGQAVALLQTTLPGSRVNTWLVDCPALFDRPGNPYHDAEGQPWPDNAQRYALFCRVVALLALDHWGLGWRPQLLHLNDWQTGLVPVWLRGVAARPATLFTIHNLAYQGNFDPASFTALGLDPGLWHYQALEFHGQWSCMKGGLVYADAITTVSPRYAEEVQTAEFGHGLEGLLQHRAADLTGILNGIDSRDWNPGGDPHISAHYNRQRLGPKAEDKAALQVELGLPPAPGPMLMGLVSRLVEQKGVDLVLAALPQMMAWGLQMVVLGRGEAELEGQLQEAAARYPGQLVLRLGYDEGMAHRIEAGCDLFLMPSRFEPCGLNQMYSLRYGTLPVVTPVGGLLDTVVDADAAARAQGRATGFVMTRVDVASLVDAVGRARVCFEDKRQWTALQRSAMAQDYSWGRSAEAYRALYTRLVNARRG